MTRATADQLGAPQIPPFLDALAWGETSVADGDAEYCQLYGKANHFGVLDASGNFVGSWPQRFVIWSGVIVGSSITHAAGRYQFEPGTWGPIQTRLCLPDFGPLSQDIAAWANATEHYAAGEGWDLFGDLQSAEIGGDNANSFAALLSDIAVKLNPQWASLNPATFPSRYASCATKAGLSIPPLS
jgi:muramidase (phage lysozyme)